MPVFHQLVAERRNEMTEGGAMEQIASTECCALRFCLHTGLLVGRRSTEPLFCRFFAAPVLQHSMSE